VSHDATAERGFWVGALGTRTIPTPARITDSSSSSAEPSSPANAPGWPRQPTHDDGETNVENIPRPAPQSEPLPTPIGNVHPIALDDRRLAEMVPVGVSLETKEAVMLRFQWNSLRTGDAVTVHDDLDPDLALWEEVVKLVETRPWDINDVAIRSDKHNQISVRPPLHAVHLLPLDTRSCWRCERTAAQADLHKAAA
jgi:hypothetical protein